MAPRKPKPTGPTPVEATIHVDTRANIPTSQLAHMVDDAETAPAKVRYKRDPSLDPQ